MKAGSTEGEAGCHWGGCKASSHGLSSRSRSESKAKHSSHPGCVVVDLIDRAKPFFGCFLASAKKTKHTSSHAHAHARAHKRIQPSCCCCCCLSALKSLPVSLLLSLTFVSCLLACGRFDEWMTNKTKNKAKAKTQQRSKEEKKSHRYTDCTTSTSNCTRKQKSAESAAARSLVLGLALLLALLLLV